MKMNNKIGSWLERSFTDRSSLAALLLSAMLLTACFRGMEEDVSFRPGTGERVQATLTFNMNASLTDVRTRSALDAGGLKLETVWVGVFDTQTGEMLGYLADRPRKSDGTRVKMNDNGGTWTVEDMDIWYYDNNPEVYIASVVNYEFVEARKVGEEKTTDLAELLGVKFNADNIPEVTRKITWDDLRAISVVTSSIDKAMQKVSSDYNTSPAEDYALAMGFFNTSNGVHTTIDREGKTPANARVPLTKNGSQFVSDLQPEGRVYLRRMQSDITVNINFSTTPSYDYVEKVNSIRYKVINKPVEMYLAEHAVDQIGGSLSGKDNYRSRSANSADWLDEGYESDEDWIPVADGSLENGYTFTYSHYENKHWGIDWEMEPGTNFGSVPWGPGIPSLDSYNPDTGQYEDTETWTWQNYFDEVISRYNYPLNYLASGVQATAAHRIREAKLTDGEQPLFKSLSEAENRSFNNNASYFIIEADLEWRNAMDNSIAKGKYYYTIHEGYTSRADGSAVPSADKVSSKKDIYDAVCDFQTVRNTKYTYNITLAGIYTITMQAERGDAPGTGTMHDDGLTGQTWRSEIGDAVEIEPVGMGVFSGKNGSNHDVYYYPEIIHTWIDVETMDARQTLKMRLYCQTPDGEFNAGNFDPNAPFEWPAVSGTTYSFEELKNLPDEDPLKQWYNSFKIHIGRFVYSDYVQVVTNGNFYGYAESLLAMTMDQYLAGADQEIYRYYDDPLYFFITCDEYKVEDKVSNFPYYHRALYVLEETEDEDGCFYSRLWGLYSQDPYNIGAEMEYFEPIFMQYPRNEVDPKYSGYSAVRGFTQTEYIRWYAGRSYYENDEDPASPYWGGNYHEPTSYTLKIGTQTVEITYDSQYRRDAYFYEWGTNFYYPSFAYPFNPNDFEPGDYDVIITPHYNEEYVQPVEPIVTKLHIGEKPLWTFDNVTFPQIGYLPNGYYYYYNSMLVRGIGNSSGAWLNIDNQDGGHLNFGASGSFNSGVLRFVVDKHGTFRVRVNNNNNNSRQLGFAGRDAKGNTLTATSEYISRNDGKVDVYLNTHDVIDNFDDGPAEVGIYSVNRLDIFEVEWVEDEDQRPSLNGSKIYYSNVWYDESNNSYELHPRNYWSTYYFTPGLTNYFGFYDTNPRATQYKVGIYANTQSTRPILEWIYDAGTYRTGYDYGGSAYFVVPIHVPDGLLSNNYSYCMAVTPVHPDYPSANPQFLYANSSSNTYFARVYLHNSPQIDWWNNNYATFDGPNNPFYYTDSFSYAVNAERGNYSGPYQWLEYFGLILHDGTAQTNVYSDYIQFGGYGYPYENTKPVRGRYLSFTTSRPGEVVLTAASTNSADLNRGFLLYAIGPDGVPELRDMKTIGADRAPFALLTGRVEEQTEFIICPRDGVRLYSAKFIPNDDIDDRETLNTSVITYSNWSANPEKPIHPAFYDIEAAYDGDNDDFSDYFYRTFPLLRHFGSPISFSDDKPRAKSYKLQLFDESTFNNEQFDYPDYEVIIDAATYRTYNGSDKHVFTYPLFLGKDCDFHSGYYLAFITPVGDSNTYRPASPQFLTRISYNDWTSRDYMVPPVIISDDDPTTEEIYNSPAMGWLAPYYSLAPDPDSSSYPPMVPKTRNLEKGDYIDLYGMTVNGSGVEANKYTVIKRYNANPGDAYGEMTDWWIGFPGEGYPVVSTNGADRNVGTGRNITFTTDVAGKIVMIACAGTDQVRKFSLYKKTGNTVTLIAESNEITDRPGSSILPDDDSRTPNVHPVQLTIKPEDVSGKTEFIICPKGGSSEFFEIIFFAEGSAAYEYDWSQGFPAYPDDYSLTRSSATDSKVLDALTSIAKRTMSRAAPVKVPFK